MTEVLVSGGVGAMLALAATVWALVERGRAKDAQLAAEKVDRARERAEVRAGAAEELHDAMARQLETLQQAHAEFAVRAANAEATYRSGLEVCNVEIPTIIREQAAHDPEGAAAAAGAALQRVLERLPRQGQAPRSGTLPGRPAGAVPAPAATGGAGDQGPGR